MWSNDCQWVGTTISYTFFMINNAMYRYSAVSCIDTPLSYRQSCRGDKHLSLSGHEKNQLIQSNSPCNFRAVGIVKVTRVMTPRPKHSPVVI